MKKAIGLITAALFGAMTMNISAFGAQQLDVIKEVELDQHYDESTGTFIQLIDGQTGFSSTIPQDLITTGGVRFDHFSEEVIYVLEKNGTIADYEGGQLITEEGQYHLQLLVMPQINLDGMDEPSAEQLQSEVFSLENLQILDREYTISADFYFTIVETAQSGLNYIKAPKDYQISQLTQNGTALTLPDPRWCRIDADGKYLIRFQPQKTGMPEYETVIEKDTQPPLLVFEGTEPDGTAKKWIKYKSTEENCTIDIFREGRPFSDVSGELYTPGLYRLVVKDQAGNATSYMVRIKEHYPVVLLSVLLGGILILTAGTYLVFRHQEITVR